jgi:hypothetical protein
VEDVRLEEHQPRLGVGATLSDNPSNPNQIGWQAAADRANIVGAALAAEGLRWYWHPEQNAFQFFNDPC